MARPKATKKPRVAPELRLTAKLLKRKRWVVASCPELDVWSQGDDEDEARRMIAEAVRIFLEETARMGTLPQILKESKLPPVSLGEPLRFTLTFPDRRELSIRADL